MSENQETQKNNEPQEDKKVNDAENSAESAWRPTDGEGELKEATKNSTGSAAQSPAQPAPDQGEDS